MTEPLTLADVICVTVATLVSAVVIGRTAAFVIAMFIKPWRRPRD